MAGPVVMLAIDDEFTRMIYHALAARVEVSAVILENRAPLRSLVARRVRKLGLTTVAGQVLFRLLIVPWLRRTSRKRAAAILHDAGLVSSPIPTEKVHRVPSVNALETGDLLASLAPAVVAVNGTRIIQKSILARCPGAVINMHAGITPAYRGVHGGYWALWQGAPERCGVTIHRVDEGIDTGAVVSQAVIRPGIEDSFTTYQLLQWAAGVPLLVEAVVAAREGRLQSRPGTGPSRLWSHPTLWGYLWARWTRSVR